ncbi:hypothetical protein EDC04DRAFT_2870834 [Pisolithus marmoratus]|nr:hypothetical protein EDC04DRAFT_2870834 [Pisolithus marmoratus]
MAEEFANSKCKSTFYLHYVLSLVVSMTNEQSGQLDLVATGTSGPALPAKTTSGEMAVLFDDTRRQPDIMRTSTTFFPPAFALQTCILDILRHLPRSLFSDTQLHVFLWGLSVLGVDSIPSTRVLKDLDNSLQSQYGIPSIRYQGSLGHVYYVNHLPSLIAQEMANPHIHMHIRHYPEDAGGRLDQPWQALRWLHEIDPSIAMPMIRKGQQDFYVFELTKYDTVEVTANQLLLSFPHLLQTYQVDREPDPCNIIGLIETRGHSVLPWTLTDPTIGNRWRARAQGHCVLSYMIWLYCDDMSGNTSKKWNKHNSFLFTAAGLPRAMVHKECNIHFLVTSNIAPPLEMLDGVMHQLELAQMQGIWAWDVTAREMVLIFPAVLAMLGDNPMQSELACHIGLQGKFFCHNCWVKGADLHPARGHADGVVMDLNRDDACSVETQSRLSESEEGSAQANVAYRSKGKGRRSETMQGLMDRAHRFLGVRYVKMKTDTGIKDTYMDVFVERILKLVKGLRAGTDKHTEAVNSQRRCFSSLSGLDPHQDTPVEILHVILLGFVKYFWRDAMSRLNEVQKAELQVRLASFDVTGLGIPLLAGHTLVQYAGSLTSQDFRTISQAAPFVLYDLVPRPCYEAFLALSALIPLVWKPCIENVEEHLVHHIRRFGPAILFATEGIHNIARRMARCHRVHHFLSGGKFHAPTMSMSGLHVGQQCSHWSTSTFQDTTI